MRIEQLKLTNWCQHADRTVDFAPGLNAVRGPNGSGKTNLLNALVFAVCGDLSRLSGVKADNIRKPEAKGPAGVEARLTHGRAELTIVRHLRPAGQSLRLAGRDEPWTRAEEIARELQRLLGVPARLLLDYVFVPQWGIFGFIDQQPAVRAKAFGELFGAERAEQIWRILGEERVEVPLPSLSSDQIKLRLQEERAELAKAVAALTDYADVSDDWDPATDVDYLVTRCWAGKQEALAFLAARRKLLDEAAQAAQQAADREAALRREEGELAALLQHSAPAAEAARSDLALWEVHRRVGASRFQALEDLRKWKNALALEAPLPACPAEELDALQQKVNGLEREARAMQAFLATFASTQAAACPTCGTPTSQLAGTVAEYRCRLPDVAAALREAAEAYEQARRQSAAAGEAEKRRRHYQERIAATEQRLRDLGELPAAPARSEAELRQLVADYAIGSNLLDAKERDAHSAAEQRADLHGRLQALGDEVLRRQREADALQVTAEAAAAAQLRYEERFRRFTEKFRLKARAEAVGRQIVDDEAALETGRREERLACRARGLAAHLEEVRSVCKDLPKLIAERSLAAMRTEIDDMLALFEAPFRIQSVDDLCFRLRFHDGKVQPAERLSGGERVLFALAVRIVVNAHFAGDLGLLCLDEPTAGLDADNRGCLDLALEKLRVLSRSRGLQVILVTHDPGVDAVCDQVIRL